MFRADQDCIVCTPTVSQIPPNILPTQSGEETFFKVKKTTKMSKIFNAYASRKGVDPASLRFLLDGDNVDPNQTPKMLELEDQDQIDCVLEQVGGRW
jgi:small ubiquitin-related modifier